ncbi:MAG: 4-alpha-glucanotransferase [Candidatus Adiutrix sp.]
MTYTNDGLRAAGLLIHPTSLPSSYGLGDLGPGAYEMIRFLKKSHLHFWQMLPLNPTSPGLGNSPYSAYSAFAANPLLISPELLVRDGWVTKNEATWAELPPSDTIDFAKVIHNKNALFDLAFNRAENNLETGDFADFTFKHGTWLNDFAFFMAAKNYFGGDSWLKWPEKLRLRDDSALREYGTNLRRPILREKFIQYLFFSQLEQLRQAMHQEGLGLIGDAAIYINHDSSDVWAQPHLFCLDPQGLATVVAGVPPDYFAADGQLWGNPLFDWGVHLKSDFDWWKNRLWHNFKQYDWVRLDHFRAFAAYWEVPREAKTAAYGQWRLGPGEDLFKASSAHGPLNIIAEDLGLITPDVTKLRQEFAYPGMRVLQFAFGPDFGLSTHAPFRIEPDNVVYSATHDNNTTRGWFRTETDHLKRKQLRDWAGHDINEENAAWALIKMAWQSSGFLAITTMQDLLNLDEKARLNVPGTAMGNWGWRLSDFKMLTDELANKIGDLNALAGRDNTKHPNTLSYEALAP